MQAGEVSFKVSLRLEIHVEANQVQERQVQIFGRGIVGVAEKPLRVFCFGDPVKRLDETLHPARPVPAHDGRGDLVGDDVSEDRGMARAGADLGAYQFLDLTGNTLVVEKARALFHLQPDHDAKALPLGKVEQPARRHVVGADGVHAVGRDLGKIALDNFRVRVRAAIPGGSKRPVGHAAHVELLLTDPNEFASHARPQPQASGASNGSEIGGNRCHGQSIDKTRFGRLSRSARLAD